MFDQEADESLMRAERRSVNAERRFVGVVFVVEVVLVKSVGLGSDVVEGCRFKLTE